MPSELETCVGFRLFTRDASGESWIEVVWDDSKTLGRTLEVVTNLKGPDAALLFQRLFPGQQEIPLRVPGFSGVLRAVPDGVEFVEDRDAVQG